MGLIPGNEASGIQLTIWREGPPGFWQQDTSKTIATTHQSILKSHSWYIRISLSPPWLPESLETTFFCIWFLIIAGAFLTATGKIEPANLLVAAIVFFQSAHAFSIQSSQGRCTCPPPAGAPEYALYKRNGADRERSFDLWLYWGK